ncbi:MAG: sialidase family protein [Kiritimatiellia bacterium]
MKTLLTFVALLVCATLPAAITAVKVAPTGIPAFIGRDDVSVAKVTVTADGAAKTETVKVSFQGTMASDLKKVRLGEVQGRSGIGNVYSFKMPVTAKETTFDLYLELSPKADLSRKVMVEGAAIRIGSIVTRPGQKIQDTKRICKAFRIPGIVETMKGTLVAVFDNRYNHAGDLPADITVGVSTSKDQGNTWSPIHTAMNYKGLSGGQGIGDPCILVDPSNNRIWIAAVLASKKGNPIWSAAGSDKPEICGQLYLAYSDNEGKTWSDPINITTDVKRMKDADTAQWGCVFQGPGNGIAMKDGTLVFPAQIWGKKHYGVLVYSKDHGKTWTSSKEMEMGGSESTCAELKDGSIVLNTREGAGGWRAAGITKDLGATWMKDPNSSTETGRLRQPVCQGAMLRIGDKLYFSNPNSGKRDTMTLKVSADDGKTWSAGICYDPRATWGYSSLAPVGKNAIGVLYESNESYHYFLRIPLDEVK